MRRPFLTVVAAVALGLTLPSTGYSQSKAVPVFNPTASPAPVQREYTLDTTTGVVTAKDVEQDKAIAAHNRDIAAMKAELDAVKRLVAGQPAAPAPAKTVAASGVAAPADPFAVSSGPLPCPCGPGCPCTTAATTAPTAAAPSTSRPVPVRYEELTYTVAGPATSGITSLGGCANGACATGYSAPARSGWYLGKNLGR